MIEGYIEKIIYRNEENGYTVLSVMVDEKLDLTQVLRKACIFRRKEKR